MSRRRLASYVLAIVAVVVCGLRSAAADELTPAPPLVSVAPVPPLIAPAPSAADLAAQVKIYRDSYGTPHIEGETDQATLFGFAYAQAEDNFWQLEDNYILGIGRYSEVHGPKGLNSDLLNRGFEIVPKAKANYRKLEPEIRSLFDAFAAGLNYYLEQHPETKPRLITHFEPWHTLSFGRHATLEMCYRYTRLNDHQLPRRHDLIWHASGSNGWAIAPTRTKSRHAMLLVNPHLPWFGFSTMYEAHLRSGEGWSFAGGTFFGNPMLSFGHNDHLGWTVTTNEPDIADVWIETFDDPADPLRYRYGNDYRKATAWREIIRVRSFGGLVDREFTLRKTHHGPIVKQDGDQKYLAVRIAGLDDVVMLRQSMKLVRAQNFSEFKIGLTMQQFPLMNMLYADRDGTVAYLYNGLIPRREQGFDWSQPVDGSNPRTEWQGYHTIDELPQLMNPADGFLQNCNSSPFTTCDNGNPTRSQFPKYMCEDADDDKRRAKMSRQLLRQMHDVTFDDVTAAAFDTTIYWAQENLPEYRRRFEQLKARMPELAASTEPYLTHLLDWDCRITPDSTQATLCAAWYEELYGPGYPAEALLPLYAEEPDKEFHALVVAAARLTGIHGDWRVPWGQVYRIQRQPDVVEMLELPFQDTQLGLPCAGAPGPMGVIFTQYYSPNIRIPFIRTLKYRYGLVGASYLAVYEFGDRVQGATALNFGESGDPQSPHYFDQAILLSERRLKRELFHWPDVVANCKRVYRPGEEQP